MLKFSYDHKIHLMQNKVRPWGSLNIAIAASEHLSSPFLFGVKYRFSLDMHQKMQH